LVDGIDLVTVFLTTIHVTGGGGNTGEGRISNSGGDNDIAGEPSR